MKKALIIGVSGQDGAYLAKLLLKKGYKVYGSSRDSYSNQFANLRFLGIYNDLELISLSVKDFGSVVQSINKINPNEIYNLAGQSSVSLSFEHPVETNESIVIGNLNILEAIRVVNKPIRFYNAGSSEIFGNLKDPANEDTYIDPKSPYGVAKAAAYYQVVNYREAYNLFSCTGILFNHESPLRRSHFVTAKIIEGVCKIHLKKIKKIKLGNLNIIRDWGWAPEFVEAMWKMLQEETPNDYVIGTGLSMSLEGFVQIAFDFFNLNWRDYVEFDKEFVRPSDIKSGYCDPSKAKKQISWEAKLKGENLVRKLIECQLNSSAL